MNTPLKLGDWVRPVGDAYHSNGIAPRPRQFGLVTSPPDQGYAELLWVETLARTAVSVQPNEAGFYGIYGSRAVVRKVDDVMMLEPGDAWSHVAAEQEYADWQERTGKKANYR